MTFALAFGAVVLTTASWLPQVARSFRRWSAADFSWVWLGMFATGVACWLGYGLLRDDPAIIIANAVTLATLLALAALKWQTDPCDADQDRGDRP